MAKKKRVVRRKQPQNIISDEITIPNHSGMLDAGVVHRTPTDDLDPVNKKYVDDSFPVTHASTTGQTANDHHNEAHTHTHASTTGRTATDHHDNSNDHAEAHTLASHSTKAHSELTGVTADLHHAQSHNVASHSDTSATGAELNTLTDNSIANTLHRHSELVASDGAPDPAVSVNSSGNVGIGTTSPNVTLQLGDSSNSGKKFKIVSSNANTDIIQIREITDAYGINLGLDATLGDFVMAPVINNVEQSEAFRIQRSSGNVGIGTSSPTYPLSVNSSSGASGWVGEFLNPDRGKVLLGSRAIGIGSIQATNTTGAVASLSLNSDGGNVGIGTASPVAALEVGGTASKQIKVNSSGGIASFSLWQGGTNQILLRGSGGDSYINAGNVGIGTSSPSEKLDINSDAIRIRTAQTPASAGAAGTAGMICWDASYIYVCTATNTWKRTAIATW